MMKMLTDYVVTNYPPEDSEVPSVDESTNSEASIPKKRKVIFHSWKMMTSSKPTTIIINQEISKYLEEPALRQNDYPLVFWKENTSRFPILSRVAQSLLAIPASSAPVERLFSIAGKLFGPDRCRLSDGHFQKLVFIRSNNSIQ